MAPLRSLANPEGIYLHTANRRVRPNNVRDQLLLRVEDAMRLGRC